MQKIQELTQQDKDRFMGILKDYIQAINQPINNKEAMPPLEKWKDQLDSILQKINLEVIFSESNNPIQNQVNFFRKDLDEEKYPCKFESGPYIVLHYSLDNQDLKLFFFVSQNTPHKNIPTYKGPSEIFLKRKILFRKERIYKNQSIFSQKFLDDFLALENAFNSLEIDDFGAIDYLSFYCFHLIFPRIYILDLVSVKNNDYFEAMEKLFENPDFAKKNQHIKIQCQESDGNYFYVFTDSDYQNLYFAIKGEKSEKPFMVNRKDFRHFLNLGGISSHLKSHQEYMNDFLESVSGLYPSLGRKKSKELKWQRHQTKFPLTKSSMDLLEQGKLIIQSIRH